MPKLRDMKLGLSSLCALAGAPFEIHPGGKHYKLKIFRGERHEVVTFSATPSDEYALAQASRDVTRALRRLGYGV